MLGEVDKKIKRLTEKGITLIEGLVATAIIGIGFVAVFQMVQYSVRSIDVSGERTKATYIAGMVAEDLYSDKDQERAAVKFIDDLVNRGGWSLSNSQCGTNTPIPLTDYTKTNAVENKMDKWTSRMSKDFLKCTNATTERKKLNMYKMCRSGCLYSRSDAHDDIYIGKMELKLESGTKTKRLYFQVK